MSLILDDSQLELLAYLVSAEAERLDHEAHMKETGRSRPTRWEKAHAEGLRAWVIGGMRVARCSTTSVAAIARVIASRS